MSDRRIGPKTVEQAGNFLFKLPPGDEDDKTKSVAESKGLDSRTRIKSEAGMKSLLYLSVLSENMGSEVARKIKDSMERLFIAYDGAGRAEAVDVLRQQFPKRIEIERGRERTDDL